MRLNPFAGILAAAALALVAGCGGTASKEQPFAMDDFLGFPTPAHSPTPGETPKTLFQTNIAYDERIAIPVDGVILHKHGDADGPVHEGLRSWAAKGFVPQRMFFSDSDAGDHYTKGRFDGAEHPGDIERLQDGTPVLCGGARPYMLPTPGWTRYLESLAKQAIDGGARAIYPEEPLAHAGTGYEDSFKPMYESEYKKPWMGSHESPDAFFKTARLKNKLYRQLEQDLERYTRDYAAKTGRDVDFYIPIHSLYSNLAAHLVAPLGSSLSIEGHDGYIGQIWSGPVQWAMGCSKIRDASFFDGAYVLYDYFVNLVLDSDKTLYLLSDPVEDDASRAWPQYESWYKECIAAKLMFPEIATFEIMPWPDRIFLPGYTTGGGTPGPDHYRTILMSVATVLQDVPKSAPGEGVGGTPGIGLLVGDSAMWQSRPNHSIDMHFGLLIPALKRGLPIATVPAERIDDPVYMKRFNLILLSYDGWKPASESIHAGLKKWVDAGGVLVVFDGRDEFDTIDEFWKAEGFPNPQAHLLAQFGIDYAELGDLLRADGAKRIEKVSGKGHVVITRLSPSSFADVAKAANDYLPLLRWCASELNGHALDEPERFLVQRGRFVIAHAFGKPSRIDGRFVDVFDAELSLREGVDLKPDESAILVDVADMTKGRTPRILHATYRLLGSREEKNVTTLFVAGPAGSRGATRIYRAGKTAMAVEGRDRAGNAVEVDWTESADGTLLARFPYRAEGMGIRIEWGK